MKALLLFFTVFGLFYLMGAFYSASLDISKWSESTRENVVVIGGFLSVFSTAFFLISNLLEQKETKKGLL
jgi:hypothetical protein